MEDQWIWIIKVVGIYELVAGILIIYGERLGSLLALANKIVGVIFAHYTLITKGVTVAANNHVDLASIPLLIGVLLIFLAKYDAGKEKVPAK